MAGFPSSARASSDSHSHALSTLISCVAILDQPISGIAINSASRRFSPDAIFMIFFLESRKQSANLPNAALSPGNLEKWFVSAYGSALEGRPELAIGSFYFNPFDDCSWFE